MLAGELVSMLVRDTNNGISRQEALELINMAHRQLLCRDTLFTKIIPEPTLTTTAGQLAYTLPLGIRNCSRGYILGGPIGNWNYIAPGYPQLIGDPDRTYIEFFCPIGVSPDIPLEITFPDDPGNTTVYLEAYWWPNTILEESDALQIPDNHATQALRAQVMVWWEERNFGNSVYWAQTLERQKNAWVAYSSQGNEARAGRLRPSRIYG